MRATFDTAGFTGPVRVLSPAQCRLLLTEAGRIDRPLIPDWHKALATVSPAVYAAATHPAIIGPVREILGSDVMLWGASFVRRRPGHSHPWHNDMESSVSTGQTVSVWIGLKNTTKNAALQLIAQSHRYRRSVQEVRHHSGIERKHLSLEDALLLACGIDAGCTIAEPDMADGDALFFDGWLWHASENRSARTRTALLLQYATPDTVIRIPDPNSFEWPFRYLVHPKPPCIMVSGSDHSGVNRIVPAPATHDEREQYTLSSRIYPIGMPLATDPVRGWRPYPILRGSTSNLQSMSCHVSVLEPAKTPHPPHHHREEEILMLLDGAAELTLPGLASLGLSPQVWLKPGQFVYYPAWFYHTITARGEKPATYMMFKWFNTNGGHHDEKQAYGKYDAADFFGHNDDGKIFSTKRIFQGPTECLKALQCHTSVVLPGGGYAAHTDAHDVALIILKGEVECLGERCGPHSVLYFPAGHLHDMHNPGDTPAEYLVFEFHGRYAPPMKRRKRTLWEKMRDPRSWRQKVGEIRGKITW